MKFRKHKPSDLLFVKNLMIDVLKEELENYQTINDDLLLENKLLEDQLRRFKNANLTLEEELRTAYKKVDFYNNLNEKPVVLKTKNYNKASENSFLDDLMIGQDETYSLMFKDLSKIVTGEANELNEEKILDAHGLCLFYVDFINPDFKFSDHVEFADDLDVGYFNVSYGPNKIGMSSTKFDDFLENEKFKQLRRDAGKFLSLKMLSLSNEYVAAGNFEEASAILEKHPFLIPYVSNNIEK